LRQKLLKSYPFRLQLEESFQGQEFNRATSIRSLPIYLIPQKTEAKPIFSHFM
jgi:hypothetical protein